MKSSRRSISEESQLTRSCNRQRRGKQIHETKAVRRQLFLHRFPSTVSRRTSRPENAYEHSSRKTLADLFPSTSLALWKFFSLGENTRILDSRHFCTTCATIASNETERTNIVYVDTFRTSFLSTVFLQSHQTTHTSRRRGFAKFRKARGYESRNRFVSLCPSGRTASGVLLLIAQGRDSKSRDDLIMTLRYYARKRERERWEKRTIHMEATRDAINKTAVLPLHWQ